MVLSKADDYPIHQTPEPIAHAGSDRNFYDRYFFNAYNPDGSLYIAVALGVYPQLGIMDAAFSMVRDGSVQHNLRASRHLHGERMDTIVGPIEVEVLDPLQRLAVRVHDNDHGIRAELIFEGRADAIEEPRFIHRQQTRTVMDYTRLTQAGAWSGWVEQDGIRTEITATEFRGTRDRSWGIRPVGAADSQPSPGQSPHFFWLWCPVNFDDFATFWHSNDDETGAPWNRSGVICDLKNGTRTQFALSDFDITFESGTRNAVDAHLSLSTGTGDKADIHIKPTFNFLMPGIGYRHESWRHGANKGPLAVGYDTYILADMDRGQPAHCHVQGFGTATLNYQGHSYNGRGILEQLIIGPHLPSGFTEMFDTAP